MLMLEESRHRNFAETAICCYLHGLAHFSRYLQGPPDQLGPDETRKYQAMPFIKLKLILNTVTLRLASSQFFDNHVLKHGWSIAETPYPQNVRHLPQILTQEEVARLIDATDSSFHRIVLMALYSTGRTVQSTRLKVGDIDSQPIVVHTLIRSANRSSFR
jgi:site-specific recombinase XerD